MKTRKKIMPFIVTSNVHRKNARLKKKRREKKETEKHKQNENSFLSVGQ
jgi:hypothetical protein